MSLISFSGTAAGSTWTPSINPSYGGGYAVGKLVQQPKDFSDGGDIYSYGHGEVDSRTFSWPMLPATDVSNLITFMDAVRGGACTFEFTDYDAATYSARLKNYDSFEYRYQDISYFEVTVEIEIV